MDRLQAKVRVLETHVAHVEASQPLLEHEVRLKLGTQSPRPVARREPFSEKGKDLDNAIAKLNAECGCIREQITKFKLEYDRKKDEIAATQVEEQIVEVNEQGLSELQYAVER